MFTKVQFTIHIHTQKFLKQYLEENSEPCKTSKMKHFANIVNEQGSEYASDTD